MFKKRYVNFDNDPQKRGYETKLHKEEMCETAEKKKKKTRPSINSFLLSLFSEVLSFFFFVINQWPFLKMLAFSYDL